MTRKGKYVDASLYQPGQADQLNRNTPDVDTKRILQAEAVGFDGENISFRDVTQDVRTQEIMESGAAEGENVAEVAGDGEGSGENINTGEVEFFHPKNATIEEIEQIKRYVDLCNEAQMHDYLSPTGRVSTRGQLRRRASKAAEKERKRAAIAGVPYKGHVGHAPDTTWTGKEDPFRYLDLSPRVNESLGAQAVKYPIGYKPTKFVYKGRGKK